MPTEKEKEREKITHTHTELDNERESPRMNTNQMFSIYALNID